MHPLTLAEGGELIITIVSEVSQPTVPTATPIVYLLEVSSETERQIVRDWLCDNAPQGETIEIAATRRRSKTDPRLDARLGYDDDPYLVPVRVAWLAEERDGNRSARWSDLLKLGDPRDPNLIRERFIRRLNPERLAVVVGEGARASALFDAHKSTEDVVTLREFVTRRAWLALERAERQLRGYRYKIPKFLHEDLTSRPSFRDGSIRFGETRGLREQTSLRRASYYLREMAASHSPFLIDLIANAIHALYRRGYGSIRYEEDALAQLATIGQKHPLVFLPSHRSHFDRISLQYVLWENDMPPNHTAGGINMNFFPVGPLIRRTGVFFIRRSFKGNELYKFVVKQYLDYLIERRFPLEWYIEGGRSRTGKVRPPTFGLLSWVIDSWRRGKADDVVLVPISIAYDEIQDVGAYADEARGGKKQPESFGWAVGAVRNLASRYGNIHVCFADPISLSDQFDGDTDPKTDLEIQKVAFEVSSRISRATPVTPTSLVSIALAVAGGKPQSAQDLTQVAMEHADYVASRDFPITEPLPPGADGVTQVLERLVEQGTVTHRVGRETNLYWTNFDQSLQAGYYRNMVVHFFVPRAMAELALTGAAGLEEFWDRIAALRDLLKFEFFFYEKEEFRRDLVADLTPEWEERVEKGNGAVLLGAPLTAPWVLGPIIEAYLIVADEMVADPPSDDPDDFMTRCLDRGRFYLLDGRIDHDSGVTRELFGSGLELVSQRGITTPEERQGFATEMADWHRMARLVSGQRSSTELSSSE